jgi:hypothetical protein
MDTDKVSVIFSSSQTIGAYTICSITAGVGCGARRTHRGDNLYEREFPEGA